MIILQISPVIIFLAEVKVKMQNVMGIKKSAVDCPLNPFVRKRLIHVGSKVKIIYNTDIYSVSLFEIKMSLGVIEYHTSPNPLFIV